MTAFALTGHPGTYRVDLDGADITRQITGVALAVGPGYGEEANSRPEVEVRLNASRLELALEHADVRVDPETAALLVRLGWTPPKELP